MDLPTLEILCALIMHDEPSKLAPEAKEKIIHWANEQALLHGFNDWMDVFIQYQIACPGLVDVGKKSKWYCLCRSSSVN